MITDKDIIHKIGLKYGFTDRQISEMIKLSYRFVSENMKKGIKEKGEFLNIRMPGFGTFYVSERKRNFFKSRIYEKRKD